MGGVLSFVDYNVRKEFNGNPLFTFRGDISWNFPAEARSGVGDPDLSSREFPSSVSTYRTIGAVTSRLTLNLGLRWDYGTSDMLNNDYVTQQEVLAATASFVDNANYFTDGDDRPPFYGALQPRFGGVVQHHRTRSHGGLRRIRPLLRPCLCYNSTLDERFRLQFAVRAFQFSSDGVHPRRIRRSSGIRHT